MKADKKLVGDRINLIRECLDLSISEMGVLLGNVSKSTVNSWIRGLALPKQEIVAKLASLSNRSETWVLYGVDKAQLKQMVAEDTASKYSNSAEVEYFVAFSYQDAAGTLHISNASVSSIPINNSDGLQVLEEKIKALKNNESVAVINFMSFYNKVV